MHIFNAGGSARWGPVPFMKKKRAPTVVGSVVLPTLLSLLDQTCSFGGQFLIT